MRAIAGALSILAALLGVACGSHEPVAPPPSELELAAFLNPDATGGMRPSTTVSAMLFLQPASQGVVVSPPLDRAEFTVWDGAGRPLAQATVSGPLPFGPEGRVTIRQVLDWMPADVLGRALTIRFVFQPSAPEASPLVIERTVTF